jgi:hypothetical protein
VFGLIGTVFSFIMKLFGAVPDAKVAEGEKLGKATEVVTEQKQSIDELQKAAAARDAIAANDQSAQRLHDAERSDPDNTVNDH